MYKTIALSGQQDVNCVVALIHLVLRQILCDVWSLCHLFVCHYQSINKPVSVVA